MDTQCYAMVRGSALRVTGLGKAGQVSEPVQFATSKSVSKIRINEVVENGGNELLSTPEGERRLRFVRNAQTIRYKVDIDFLCVDPGVLSLVAGVHLVTKGTGTGDGFDTGGFDLSGFDLGPATGFGIDAFGFFPFGDAAEGPDGGGLEEGDVVGFDATTRLPVTAFALEVWSKLAGRRCEGGQQEWGYTLFPYLRGGYLSGFTFGNGLVSFSLLGAQTRRASRWGVGPYDLQGPYERLIEPVARSTSWRTFITTAAPPETTPGVQEYVDTPLDNGTAANPMPDPDALLFVDGGGAATGPFIIDGGRAA